MRTPCAAIRWQFGVRQVLAVSPMLENATIPRGPDDNAVKNAYAGKTPGNLVAAVTRVSTTTPSGRTTYRTSTRERGEPRIARMKPVFDALDD